MSYVGKITDSGGTTHLVGSTLYGTCSTQGSTAAKVVTCSDFNKLITGVTIHVKFSLPNTAASPTLNVNSTGAKPIYKCGSTTAESTDITWPPNTIVSFTYDGTNWAMNDVKDKDVLQSPVSTSGQYEVLFSHSANNTAETASVGKNDGFLYNPSTHSLTISGNYSDTNGLLAMKEVTQAQYDALTTAEKNNGTAYFITDRLSPAATDLWTKVGTATLNTTAQDCSAAINELNTEITDTHTVTELLNVTGINAMTTATSNNLSEAFTNYEYLIIQLRAYNNVYQTTFVTSSYFNGTGSGTRPILMGFNTSGTYLGSVEVYKNTASKVYIKASSGNTFGSSYRICILGVMKKV